MSQWLIKYGPYSSALGILMSMYFDTIVDCLHKCFSLFFISPTYMLSKHQVKIPNHNLSVSFLIILSFPNEIARQLFNYRWF